MTDDSKIHSLKRPAIERMLRIHREIKSGKFPNCTTLAREFEVSTKTISRDLDFMRDRMLLPIEYEAIKHGFYYTREVESLPSIDISEGELLALSIAQKALDHYKGSPFEKPLTNALNKLAANLPDTITANLTELSDSISFRHGSHTEVDEDLLQTFTKAAIERRELSFTYKKLGAKEGESRTIRPYHLTNFLGKWYVLGWDNARQAIRTFLLIRAKNPVLSNIRFTIPKTFSAEDYLGSSFGIYSPEGDHKIAIKFENPISEYIAENTWHSSQSVDYHDDGTITIRFKLGNLQEVESWILSWGENATALDPKALKTRLKKTALAIAARY